MIKMVVFFSVAGTTTIPKTRLLQQHGPAVSPFWKNFGRRRLLSSLLSAGSFQGSLQHVRALFHITGSYLITSQCSSYRMWEKNIRAVFLCRMFSRLQLCQRYLHAAEFQNYRVFSLLTTQRLHSVSCGWWCTIVKKLDLINFQYDMLICKKCSDYNCY